MRYSIRFVSGFGHDRRSGLPLRSRRSEFYTVTYVEVVPASAVQAANLLKVYRDASRKDTGRRARRGHAAPRPAQSVHRARRLEGSEGIRGQCRHRARQDAEREARGHARRAERHAPAQRPLRRRNQEQRPARPSPRSPTSTSSRRRRTTASPRSSSSPRTAASTPAICASTRGSRPTGPIISPWWRPGPTAPPTTPTSFSRRPRIFAPSSPP